MADDVMTVPPARVTAPIGRPVETGWTSGLKLSARNDEKMKTM
jgi:hypothetical protein